MDAIFRLPFVCEQVYKLLTAIADNPYNDEVFIVWADYKDSEDVVYQIERNVKGRFIYLNKKPFDLLRKYFDSKELEELDKGHFW